MMDKSRYLKIVKGLRKNGISIISDTDGDDYLRAMNAEAMTLSDGLAIIIKSGSIPTASAMFEEILHTTQIRNYGPMSAFGDKDSLQEYLRREIEANEKLIRYANAYGLTEDDIRDISRNLEGYWTERDELDV